MSDHDINQYNAAMEAWYEAGMPDTNDIADCDALDAMFTAVEAELDAE